MNMKMRTLVVSTVFVALTIVSGSALSNNLNYTTINNTDEAIVRMWVSATTSSRWVENSGVYVPPGGRQRTNFPADWDTSECYNDIQVQFKDGEKWICGHVNLCTINKITFAVDEDDGKVTCDGE
jgi:hypothetical protein